MDPGRGPVGRASGGGCGAGDDWGTSAVPSRCAGCSDAPGVGRSWGGGARGVRTSKDWAVGRAGRAGGMAGLTLLGDRA